ncbi:maleylpyruvate isomerase family mycothiol-dependent enzyme [Fodinicola feengrottensis]|uniref:Maleylpyruvate isomerase family mycothiol-dependent enzyme n=1 Tax=Fodinicola feengrottensis TaxID=435914 RepID=A0ABP4UBB2_9ACTN
MIRDLARDTRDRDLPELIGILEQELDSVAALAGELSEQDWDKPTDCPGWSVKDQVSHIVGVEQRLLGDKDPEHELPADLPYLRNEIARQVEVAVDYRRSKPGADVRAELVETTKRRLAQLRELAGGPDADPEVKGPLGHTRTMSGLLPVRTFDIWTHEQDIRNATGRPGNVDGPVAAEVSGSLVRMLPYAVGKSGLPAGTTVELTVIAPLPLKTVVLRVKAATGSEPVETDSPDVRLSISGERLARVVTGRLRPEDAGITATGEEAHVKALFDTLFRVTP